MLLDFPALCKADQDGETSMHLAAANGHASVVIALLAAGYSATSARNPYKVTPLHRAAEHGHVDVCHVLLGDGADPSAREMLAGRTPLLVAALSGHEQAALALLGHPKSKAALNLRDTSGQTPLLAACAAPQCSGQTISLLIKAE